MIQVNEISKSFDSVKALKKVSFNIKKGEIFGLLGPNGAGKSTTINILSTLLEVNSGTITIDGKDLKSNKKLCKLKIGVVPQEIALYEELTAYENLLFWGNLYQIPKKELHQKVNTILALVGLTDRKNDAIKTYSGGMKRRINIASSILHEPKILLMDEPTVGVDPQSRNHVFDVIEKLNNEGMTIIYTTHYMEEAERLCDTIAIIDEGTILTQGTLKELREFSHVKDCLILSLNTLDDQFIKMLHSKNPSFKINYTNKSITIESNQLSKDISKFINQVQNAGGIIENIETHKANLESVFLKLTGKQLRD